MRSRPCIYLIAHYAIKTYGGMMVQLYHSTSTANEGEWSVSRPGRFTHVTRWIGVWVDPTANVEAIEKRKNLTPTGDRIPTIKQAARHYTDSAISTPTYIVGLFLF
jgi:DNA-binding helix-hairpin-helix protein with protein kinase domain